ncbi:ATP-binding cassette domain-containing protein [Clostridium tagluense]|uniref:ATP-binding cassette domain-containing protein n=1 Tax=Clostridium tagluense TaxID=360422 RepID=UPI002162CB35|nr:ABC transporter ATP-binding protein [Clostridium tagluense]
MILNLKNKVKIEYFDKIFKTLKKSISLIWNFNYRYIFIAILNAIFQGIVPVISLLVMKNILNAIQTHNLDRNVFIANILGFVSIEIISLGVRELYILYSTNFTEKFSKHIEVLMLEKADSLDVKDFENPTTYDLINRAQMQNGDSVISYIISWMSIFQQVITISSSIIIIVTYKIWIVLVIIIAPIIQFYFSKKLSVKQYKMVIERTSEERKCWYITFIMLLGNEKKEIELNGLGVLFINHFNSLKDKFIKQDYNIAKKIFAVNIIVGIIGQMLCAIIYIYLFYSGFVGNIQIGTLMAYATCVTTIKTGVELVLILTNTVYQKSLYIELLFNFFDITEKDKKNQEQLKILTSIQSIELINVYYKFNNNDQYTLKNINLKIKKGDTIALVGKNGAGKSTLIKIILGLYEDYEGTILINGINFHKINKSNYYTKVGCVLQDYSKFEVSIRENVEYGNVEKLYNDSEIEKALKYAEFNFENLGKKGLDTVLGHWFGEKQLSEGEWQRIAIARATIKNSDFYVFDEPDAALDVIAEVNMIRTYKKILENKLGIFVSHKVHHVNLLCNNILVIDRGEIKESGTHETLYKKKGIYYQLIANQKVLD